MVPTLGVGWWRCFGRPQKDTEKGPRGQGRRRWVLKVEQYLVKWRKAQWQGKSGNLNDYERNFRWTDSLQRNAVKERGVHWASSFCKPAAWHAVSVCLWGLQKKPKLIIITTSDKWRQNGTPAAWPEGIEEGSNQWLERRGGCQGIWFSTPHGQVGFLWRSPCTWLQWNFVKILALLHNCTI